MLISDVVDKLIIFHSKFNISYKEMARELDISDVYMSLVIKRRVDVSNSLFKRIEQLFQRFNFVEALDDKKRL